MSVGDFQWVVRSPSLGNSPHQELMLNLVVERKAGRDLEESMVDKTNRFREQRYRLSRCGIRCTYLLENMQCFTMSRVTLEKSLASTKYSHFVTIHEVSSVVETVKYLQRLTRLFQRRITRYVELRRATHGGECPHIIPGIVV